MIYLETAGAFIVVIGFILASLIGLSFAQGHPRGGRYDE